MFREEVNPLGLSDYCFFGQLDIVRELVRRGVNVNAVHREKTPLQMACYGRKTAVVRYLIANGANVTACNNDQRWTPLHMLMHSVSSANIDDDKAIIDILIANGADIEAQDRGLQTPLYHAIEQAPVERAAYLIEKGAKINVQDLFGNTPLHLACSLGELGMVRMLLQHRVDIHVKNNEAKTPLECACSFEDESDTEDYTEDERTEHAERKRAEQENRDTIIRMLLLRGALPVDVGRCRFIEEEMITIRRAIVTGPQQTRDPVLIGAPLHTDEMFRRIMEYVYGRNA